MTDKDKDELLQTMATSAEKYDQLVDKFVDLTMRYVNITDKYCDLRLQNIINGESQVVIKLSSEE